MFASPLARRLASQKGLDLKDIAGSGPRGRIIARDLRAYESNIHQSTAGPEPEPTAQSGAKSAFAHLSVEVEMDRVLARRQSLTPPAPSLNDFVIKAAAETFAAHPLVPSRQPTRIDIAVLMATANGQDICLVTSADQQTLASISRTVIERKALANQAKALIEPENALSMNGVCLTISNLGMYGIQSFHSTATSQGPALLAVGAALPKAVVRDGRLTIATMMTVTLSVDLAIVDGSRAARWLQGFKLAIENPQGVTCGL